MPGIRNAMGLLTLLTVGGAAMAAPDAAKPNMARPKAEPDVIYLNGRVITVDAGFTIRQAFAVRGDRFVAVGSDADIARLAGKHTRRIDLNGATVVPGLSDNHDHLWNSAKYLHRGVDMVGVTDWPEMARRLRAAVAQAKPGEVVFTTLGWTIDPAPTRAQLDELSRDTPIVLIRTRRGGAQYNSAALRKAGVTRLQPSFHGHALAVDGNGDPTGASPHYPASVMMIDALIPPLTPAQEDRMVAQEVARRHAVGITSIRDLAVWPQGMQALQRMRREGKLTLRIALGLEFPDQPTTIARLSALKRTARPDAWLTLDSTGEEPWAPGTVPAESYARFAVQAARIGWRPAPHVSSDAALGTNADDATNATLDAYEAAGRAYPVPTRRWYVEHVPFATPTQIARMAKLGLAVSVQDAGYRAQPNAAPLAQVERAERLAHYNPVKSLIDRGILVIGGSDTAGPSRAEMAPNNPMIPFYFYVTRRSADGVVRTPLERIGRADALRIFTINPARATFQDGQKGTIGAGKLADFVILNQDPMTVTEDRILDTRPLATFVGGRRVYAAKGSPF